MQDKEFYIGPDFERLPQAVLDRLRDYGACVVSDAMKGFNAMDERIRAVAPGRCVCGSAVTVRLRPGDNLMLHRAIECARPGDILVLDTGGSCRHAVIGGIMSGAAFGKGIGGLIIDGAVRDVEELRQHGYPVFAAAVVPNTGDSEGPGQLNRPVSCGGVPVLPGDAVVADDNGVAVVPRDMVDWVLENCEKKIQAEEKRMAEIRQGRLTAAGIAAKLEKAGY
ncbi:RraA family protein [Dysosmobacter sp.]